jgi:hypothetical protein
MWSILLRDYSSAALSMLSPIPHFHVDLGGRLATPIQVLTVELHQQVRTCHLEQDNRPSHLRLNPPPTHPGVRYAIGQSPDRRPRMPSHTARLPRQGGDRKTRGVCILIDQFHRLGILQVNRLRSWLRHFRRGGLILEIITKTIIQFVNLPR